MELDITTRLDSLEDAHRALAAEHVALLQICRAMLPLIDFDPAVVRKLLLAVYDTSSEHMDTRGHDAQYQQDVRDAIDLLSEPILAAANMREQKGHGPAATR